MNHARPAEGCVNASRLPFQRVGLRQEGLIYVRQSDVLGRIRQLYGKVWEWLDSGPCFGGFKGLLGSQQQTASKRAQWQREDNDGTTQECEAARTQRGSRQQHA